MLGFIKGYFIIWIIAIIGWVINVIQAISGVIALPHFSDISGVLILRLIGIFAAPLGSVMGLFVW